MRSFNKLLILSSLCVLFVISGCKKQNGYVADNTRSSVTGWSYNDPKEGFFNDEAVPASVKLGLVALLLNGTYDTYKRANGKITNYVINVKRGK